MMREGSIRLFPDKVLPVVPASITMRTSRMRRKAESMYVVTVDVGGFAGSSFLPYSSYASSNRLDVAEGKRVKLRSAHHQRQPVRTSKFKKSDQVVGHVIR